MKNLNDDVTGRELSDYELAGVIGGAPAPALQLHVDNPGNTPLSFLNLLLPFLFSRPRVVQAQPALRTR